MDCARDATLEYLRTRRQFGAPIGSFQALQHRTADLLLEIEQARSAVINAATALDLLDGWRANRRCRRPAHTIGRIGTLVAEESIQLHGGIGMTWELPLAHYAKRLVMIDHQLGDEDHPSAALHRAGPPTRPERIMTAGTAPPVTQTQEPPLAPPFAAPPVRGIDDVRRLAARPWPRR